MLRAGGSAVDACVAAAFASWVAEPALTGPGGGGFLVAYDAARAGARSRSTASWRCPARATAGPVAPLEPYVVDFGTGQQMFLVGPGSCAVPGVTAGLEPAHRRLGRLPWAELTRPAVALARAGVELTPAHADVIALLEGFLGSSPEGARIFGPAGAPKRAGDRTSNPPLADTLERIAANGARELADGETAHALVAHQAATGGRLTARRPRRLPRDPPPPARAALPRAHVRDQPAAVLRRRADRPRAGGARRRAAADRRARAGERGARRGRAALGERPADARVRARALPRRGRAAGARGCRNGQVAHAASANWPSGSPWTTQISVLDADGNAASLTCSTGCGSGVVVPGTGVHLNNMLGETDLDVASLQLAPGMRLTSMMAPSLVLRDGRVELVVGSSGSARIRSAIVQVVVAALDLGLPLQEAVELARVHPEGDVLDCEGGMPGRDAGRARGRRRAGRALARAQHLLRRRAGRGAHAPRASRRPATRAAAAPASSSPPDEGGWGADGGLSKKPLR